MGRLEDARRGALPRCSDNRISSTGVWAWVAVALIALIDLQSLGCTPVRGHDTFLHYFRLPEVNALWHEGLWPSRWSPNLMFGYGYPLFNFYPPFSTSAFALIYRIAGENAILAFNATFGLSLCGAAVGMYLLARQWYSVLGALLATAAYSWSPYLLYQTFERGSLSNAIAIGLLPLSALALVRASRRPNGSRVTLAGLAVAALLLTHLPSGLMALPGLALLAGLAAFDRDKPWDGLWAAILALMVALALSACAWLPALLEIQYTKYQSVIAMIRYRDHFVYLLRWPGRVVAGEMNPPLPITLGIAQLALGLGACLASTARLWRHWRARQAWASPDLLSALGGLLAIAAAMMSTPLSAPLWDHLEFLRAFQFPWRWLDASVLFSALGSGWLIDALGKPSWRLRTYEPWSHRNVRERSPLSLSTTHQGASRSTDTC